MAIQAGGLISGLDTKSLIASLVQLERAPINRLTSKQDEAKAQISQLGKVSSKMGALSTALEDLADISNLLANSATVSDESIATASATGEAVRGSYTLGVSELATAEKDRTAAFATSTTEVTEGTLDLTVFGEDTVTIDITAGATLTDVRDAINSSDAQVSATIINTGTESYLSITSLKTGHDVGGLASDAVTITENYTGTTGQQLGFTELETAKNAAFTIDGLNFERSSNEVTDAIDGITLNLLAKTTQDVTLNVEPDPDEVVSKLDAFVEAFNIMAFEIGELEGAQKSMGRMATNELFGVVTASVGGLSGDYTSLASIGITTNAYTGEIELDESLVKEAIADDAFAVGDIFTTDTTGIAASLTTILERYTDSSSGIIQSSKDSLNTQVENWTDQIANKEARVEKYQERLTRQFTALETLMIQLQRQETSLSGLMPY